MTPWWGWGGTRGRRALLPCGGESRALAHGLLQAQAMSAGPSSVPTPEGRLVAHKYQLERLVGEGGMACVWLARNLLLDMPVALKLLRPELVSPETSARLRAEARASAHFAHPAIVRVFDVEETPSGEPCIVMELLEGETLYERLRREPLGEVELVRLLLPIAEALCFVHERGFIHRDLKPDNIFLASSHGRIQPKLLDFGIAKAVGSQARRPRSFSGTGHLVGSPGYMSPEQATGAELDERTDVWSLCVVLYEGLSQRPAFVGETSVEVLQSVLGDEPLPLFGVDPALARIVFNGLAKDRASRTGSLQRLRDELSDWLAAHETRDDTAKRTRAADDHPPPQQLDSVEPLAPRRRRWVLPVAAMAGLSLLATGTWGAVAATAPPPEAPVTVAPPRASEPVVLAPPPDLSSPPLRVDSTPTASTSRAKPAAPSMARGGPAPTSRPSAKGSATALPPPDGSSWGPNNPYGI
jgi:serine/threonine protein kinase